VAIPEAKIPAAKVAAARDQMESIKGLNKDVETVAAASADTCSHRGLRMPFFAANNPQVKDEEVPAGADAVQLSVRDAATGKLVVAATVGL
jgi:hypothetical protein